MYVYNPANFNVTRAVYASKIEQVSNFPTANSQNFNSVIEGGVYNILTGNYIGTLNSSPGLYGTMMVETGGNFITQTVTSHEAAVYTRSYYNGVLFVGGFDSVSRLFSKIQYAKIINLDIITFTSSDDKDIELTIIEAEELYLKLSLDYETKRLNYKEQKRIIENS